MNQFKMWPEQAQRRWLRDFVAGCETATNRKHGGWDVLVNIAQEVFEARLETSGIRSSLRYLFYRMVTMGYLKNSLSEATALSQNTAKARRGVLSDGKTLRTLVFPRLIDHNREVWRSPEVVSFSDALQSAADWPLDPDGGQPKALFVVVEKSTVGESVKVWLKDYGIPIVTLRGYSSQTLIDETKDDVVAEADLPSIVAEVTSAVRDRPAIVFTIGDFDASGVHLMNLFIERTDCWDAVVPIGVTFDQSEELEQAPAKSEDNRIHWFVEQYWPEEYARITHDMQGCNPKQIAAKLAGVSRQVEVEALEANATDDDPEPLRTLLMDAINQHWNEDVRSEQLSKEHHMQEVLKALSERTMDDIEDWLAS